MKQRDAANLIHALGAAWQQAVEREIRLVRCSDCHVDGTSWAIQKEPAVRISH